jgi:preprotein translocase subunit SecB
MERSSLQFKNPQINKIDFRVNDYEPDTNNMPISIEVECKVSKEEKEAVVSLDLCVGELTKTNGIATSFYFDGIISADFSWDDEIKNPEKMLKVSGGTVLLSYIRPILANLTMQAGMKPLNLPFINFTK